MLSGWLRNIRFYVLSFSILLALGIYLWVSTTVPSGNLQIVKLTEIYAFTAFTYLYVTLLISPLYHSFPTLPYRGQLVKAQRALGVSVALFALCHAYLAFFKELGGFIGLGFLNQTYIIAIICSATALLILLLLAATSFDYMVRKLSNGRWKFLHRFVYLAGVLILIHALLLGTQFADLSKPIPQFTLVMVGFLFILEARRLDDAVRKKWPNWPQVGVSTLLIVAFLAFIPHYFLPANSTVGGINIHAEHLQIAQQAQQDTSNTGIPASLLNSNSPAVQGLRGDRTKRFTASITRPSQVGSNQSTTFGFRIYDASSGFPVELFSKVYSVYMHLVIVDQSLQYFNHIHPDLQADGSFLVTTSFPHEGLYHLYIDYQPLGAIEQQQAFTVQVGTAILPNPNQPVDTTLTKDFGGVQVSLSMPNPLQATQLSIGNQLLTFTLKDATTGQPISNLKPYLEAFGHLVLINENTFDYLHVHPNNLTIPPPNSNGGPVVQFQPLGLYGPIKPGVYRAFAEFNPNNQLMLADFTISVE